MGSLYRPKLKSGRRSDVWWAKYYVDGRAVRESTKIAADTETPPQEAKRFLKAREGRVAAGLPVLPRVDRLRYDEAAADLRAHYRTTGSRDVNEAEKRLKHLDRFFGGHRLASIGGADATAYVEHRQADEIANGTINRELAVLTKMLRLAYEHRKLLRLPVIRKLKEAPPRAGFFEREAFLAVRSYLADDLQAAVSIAYALGWRVQSEVLTLERRQVDLDAGTLRLDPGTTKNDDGRIIYLPPDLKPALAAQLGRVDALQKKLGRIIPWLFPHLRGAKRQSVGRRKVAVLGEPMRDFRRAWRTACTKAGAPGMLKHDFRRTAVRNMVNAGIPERVAMKVTGHRTRAVFDRYHIVSPADLQDVARKLAGAVTGTFSGTSVSDGPSARLTPVP